MRIGLAYNWRILIVVIVVAGGIALASMAIVQLRNVRRGDTTAVEWALDDLRAVPESTLLPVCRPSDYLTALDRYRAAVREHRVPVDSVREFYQLYARLARDGRIEPREVKELSQTLDFPAHDPAAGGGDEK